MDLISELVYGSYSRASKNLAGLDRITRNISFTSELLSLLGIRFDAWPCATVTGSKGKGSTAVMLASLLQASGERVGLITSPHLRTFRERIRINGMCVTETELITAAKEIEHAVRKLSRQIRPPQYLGPGGVILALGGILFDKAKVSAVVVEAGRGGEYDEARCLGAPVSVITPVMLEHPDKLGDTVEEIARTKALITRPRSVMVSGPQVDNVRSVLSQTAAELGSKLVFSNESVRVKRQIHEHASTVCDLEFAGHLFRNVHLPLLGTHQVQNASTAIVAASELASWGVSFAPDQVANCLASLRWPGRNHVLRINPNILLDGAINEESATYACNIAKSWGARSIIAVVAVPEPKDLRGVCKAIAEIASLVVVTEVESPTLTWYNDAGNTAAKFIKDVRNIPSYQDAISFALSQSSDDSGIILLGTQSFVGAVLEYFGEDTCSIWREQLTGP